MHSLPQSIKAESWFIKLKISCISFLFKYTVSENYSILHLYKRAEVSSRINAFPSCHGCSRLILMINRHCSEFIRGAESYRPVINRGGGKILHTYSCVAIDEIQSVLTDIHHLFSGERYRHRKKLDPP